MKTVKCTHCGGTGRTPDWRVFGKSMRALREFRKLSLRDVARRVNCSAAYLSDMELGRRAWQGPKARQVLALFGIKR